MASDVKWIKIITDIFDDEKIKLIDSMPDNDAIIVIWFKLLAQAGKSNQNGALFLNSKIAYTDEMLATVFNRKLSTVRLALDTLDQFNMIERGDYIQICNWEKHQNIEGMEKIRLQTNERVKKYREKQKQLQNKDVTLRNVSVTHLEEELELDKEVDKEKDIKSNTRTPKHQHGELKNVLLTDEELKKLKAIPNYKEYIENLSMYIGSKGVKYKSHYITILNWARKDNKDKKNTSKSEPDWLNDYVEELKQMEA